MDPRIEQILLAQAANEAEQGPRLSDSTAAGAALGGGGGKALEEGIESVQGVQAQEGSEIRKDILKEAAIAGAGE